MLDEFASFAPTLLALTLLALAHGRELHDGKVLLLLLAAALGLGPLAESLLGFFGWLAMVAVLVGLFTTYAALRHETAKTPPRPRPRRPAPR